MSNKNIDAIEAEICKLRSIAMAPINYPKSLQQHTLDVFQLRDNVDDECENIKQTNKNLQNPSSKITRISCPTVFPNNGVLMQDFDSKSQETKLDIKKSFAENKNSRENIVKYIENEYVALEKSFAVVKKEVMAKLEIDEIELNVLEIKMQKINDSFERKQKELLEFEDDIIKSISQRHI